MSIERIVGLYVTDDESYDTYRKEMYPILQSYGGDFGYDFKLSEVLKSKTENKINRVFTIHFKDEESLTAFFTDAAYLEIKQKFFVPAVESVTQIAKYSF